MGAIIDPQGNEGAEQELRAGPLGRDVRSRASSRSDLRARGRVSVCCKEYKKLTKKGRRKVN